MVEIFPTFVKLLIMNLCVCQLGQWCDLKKKNNQKTGEFIMHARLSCHQLHPLCGFLYNHVWIVINYLFIQGREFAEWLTAREKGSRKWSISKRMFAVVLFGQSSCEVQVSVIECSMSWVLSVWKPGVGMMWVLQAAVKETLR